MLHKEEKELLEIFEEFSMELKEIDSIRSACSCGGGNWACSACMPPLVRDGQVFYMREGKWNRLMCLINPDSYEPGRRSGVK